MVSTPASNGSPDDRGGGWKRDVNIIARIVQHHWVFRDKTKEINTFGRFYEMPLKRIIVGHRGLRGKFQCCQLARWGCLCEMVVSEVSLRHQ